MVPVLEAAVISRINNIYRMLSSITEGMAVTASYLFRRPATIQYPNKLETPLEEQLPDGYRGILQVDTRFCIGCRICESTCPINCITIAVEKDAQTGERFLTAFNIDISKCMYCGLCSENCSTSALYHTRLFNAVTPDVEDLFIRFVDHPVALYKPPRESDSKDIPKDFYGAIVKQRMKGRAHE